MQYYTHFSPRGTLRLIFWKKKSAISAALFVGGLLVLGLLTNIYFGLSVLGLVIFEVAVVFVYRRELRSIAKTAEAYLLPSQKKVTSK